MAAEHGRPSDVDFVRLYRRTYPKSEYLFENWASDYGACAQDGSGAIGDLYLDWRAHALKYPGAHARDVKRLMDQLVDFLTPKMAICTCNDSIQGIVSELQHFLKIAPRGPDWRATFPHASGSRRASAAPGKAVEVEKAPLMKPLERPRLAESFREFARGGFGASLDLKGLIATVFPNNADDLLPEVVSNGARFD
jgi:hypothetical protein